MGSSDIAGALGKPRLMENGNESLMMMGMQKNYVDTKFTEGPSLITDEIEVSTCTANTPQDNEKLKDMLAKHQDMKPQEIL